jgi:hypothetical protein
MHVSSITELEGVLSDIDRDEPYPKDAAANRRGKRAGTQKVVLPAGYLDNLDDDTPPGPDAEDPHSGG